MSRLAVAIVVGAFVFHAVQGFLLDEPWLLPDELHAADGARVISVGGRVGAPTLASVLDAPLWLLDPGVAYHAVKLLHALALAAAVVATYLLARHLAGERRALVAAAIAGFAPTTLFASSTLSVAVATALFAGSVIAWIGRRAVVAALLLLGAVGSWPMLAFAGLPLALLAYARHVGTRRLLDWPMAAVWIAVPAFAYAALALGRAASESFVAGTSSWGLVPAAGLAGAASYALGLGIVPVVFAAARCPVARGNAPASAIVVDALVVSSAGLLLAAGVRGLGRPGSPAADEIAFLPLLPLLCAVAVAEVRVAPSRRFVAAALALGITALFLLPSTTGDLHAPGTALAHVLSLAPLTLVVVLLLLSLNAALAVALLRRRALLLPVLFAAAGTILASGELAAWSLARDEAEEVATITPERDRVTRLAGERRVNYVNRGLGPRDLAALEFWNPFVYPLNPPIDGRTPDTTTGTYTPPLPPGLVLDPNAQIGGTIIGPTSFGALIDAGNEPRAAETIEGLYADRWSGGEVFYRRFSGPPRDGVLRVNVSRAAWRGPSPPAQVVVASKPIGGEPFGERITHIESGQERIVEVPVPKPPFEVRIAIGPLFSPADYDLPDSRQLGAQIAFDYRPG